MAQTVELNKPEFVVVTKYDGLITLGGVYVVKVTYKLGAFSYIRKHKEIIMRVDGCDCIKMAEKYCEKLNEAEREVCDE